MAKIWNVIEGFDGRYSISNDQCARRNKYHIKCADGSTRVLATKALKIHKSGSGYGSYIAMQTPEGRKTTRTIASLMRDAFAFHKNCASERRHGWDAA